MELKPSKELIINKENVPVSDQGDKDLLFVQGAQLMTKHFQAGKHESCWEVGSGFLNEYSRLRTIKFLERFTEAVINFLMALSVSCFYIGRMTDGLTACDRFYCLRVNSKRGNIFNNMKFYPNKLTLESTVEFVEGVHYNGYPESMEKKSLFQPTNLSLVEVDQKVFLGNLRLVNYRIAQSGYQFDPHFGNEVVTHNQSLLIKLTADNKLLIKSWHPVKFWPDYQISSHYAGRYRGYEDLRLIKTPNERLKIFCTSLDTHPGKISISMANYHPKVLNYRSNSYEGANEYSKSLSTDVEDIVPLSCSNMKNVEKNWLPFYHENQLHCIYSIDPLIIFRVYSDGQTKTVYHRDISPIYQFKDHRGGAIIRYNGGYLILCHFTSPEILWRKYYRRFLWMDDSFQVRRASRPWNFTDELIEYSLGMTLVSGSEKILMSYSYEDRKVFLGLIDREKIDQLLISFDDF